MDKKNKLEEIIKLQEELNKKLGSLLASNGIKKLRLTSVGNSIASGYSLVRTTKPLLLRNESIKNVLDKFNINLERHNFARAQNNNDEHINEWLLTNKKESEINKLNILDYDKNSKIHMQTNELTDEKIKDYYPISIKEEKGMQDIILESNDDLANIVIYNGATGSFLDNITRNGTLSHKLTYGIKRDITSIESTLKIIQNNKRNNNTNTQVYLCGVPNYLGLNITNIINKKLKKLEKEYANVVYVSPVKAKFFYKKYNLNENSSIKTIQDFIRKIKLPSIDIHYDEIEYLEFNNSILKAIINNYENTKALINLDRQLYRLSSFIEQDQSLIENKNKITNIISEIIEEEYKNIKNKNSRNIFIIKAKKYILNRLPYDFHYAKKENIEKGINNIARK